MNLDTLADALRILRTYGYAEPYYEDGQLCVPLAAAEPYILQRDNRLEALEKLGWHWRGYVWRLPLRGNPDRLRGSAAPPAPAAAPPDRSLVGVAAATLSAAATLLVAADLILERQGVPLPPESPTPTDEAAGVRRQLRGTVERLTPLLDELGDALAAPRPGN